MTIRVYKKTVENQERAERLTAREKRRKDKLVTDSFMNFNLQLGQGTDNALSNSSYGFSPITRYRVLLEWIHRGSWLGGIAIDVAAEDAVRGGIEIHSSLAPKDVAKLQNALVRLGIWKKYTDLKKWGRLYGGAIAVYLIDGQKLDTPLNMDTIGKGQFKGLAVFDRWQCQPTLNTEGLVEEYGPDLGLPKYYIVNGDAPMLRGKKIHYTRVIRQIGIELPFYQQILEQYWGISVLERLYDRLVAFDSATSGIAQYVHKMHLRVIKIDKYRQIQAAGGKLLQGFMRFAEDMRRRQSNEGITYIDTADDFVVHNSNISSGISEALMQLGQQLSGALQMPLVRLFGQSPGGLGSNGDSELRTYYEGVNQHQERDDRVPITKICVLTAKSEGIKLDETEFGFNFRSLYQLDDQEKSAVFDKDSRAIFEAFATGLIDKPTALKELRELGRFTGRWTNITDKEIKDAENEPPQPALEDLTPKLSKLEKVGEKAAPKQLPKPSGGAKNKDAANISRALVSLKRMSRIMRDETPVMQLFGLPIVIECKKGEKRWSGGPDWPSQYGFICNALATDGDELDCFVGDDLTAQDVFVLDHNHGDGTFEELKVMLGFGSIQEALDVYRRSYSREPGDYSVTIDLKDFNHWMARTDLTKALKSRISQRDKDWEEAKHPRKSTDEFREHEHPRAASGPHAGRFVEKGAGGSGAGGRRQTRAVLHEQIRNLGHRAPQSANLARLQEVLRGLQTKRATKKETEQAARAEQTAGAERQAHERTTQRVELTRLKKTELVQKLKAQAQGQSVLRFLKDKGFQTDLKSIQYFKKAELVEALLFLSDKNSAVVTKPPQTTNSLTATQKAVKHVKDVFASRSARRISSEDCQRYTTDVYTARDVAALFNLRIKLAPERFVAVLTEGLTLERPRLRASATSLTLSSGFNGGGRLQRRFNFAAKSVEHAFLQFPRAMQGSGIAKKVLACQIETYKQLGLEKVTIHANIDVGGYAWAKYGFVPNQNSWDTYRQQISEAVTVSRAPAELKARVKVILNSSNPKAIWALADLPDEVNGEKYAKQLMFNTHWYANLSLNDAESMRRFDNYVGR